MGTLKNGFFGHYQGKLGRLVFYVINGKQVVRTIGKITKPPSTAQLKCRQELKVVNVFLKPLVEFVNLKQLRHYVIAFLVCLYTLKSCRCFKQ